VGPTSFSRYLIRDVFQFFQGFSLDVIFHAFFSRSMSNSLGNDTHSYRVVLLSLKLFCSSLCVRWMNSPFFGRRCDSHRSRPLNFFTVRCFGLLSPGYKPYYMGLSFPSLLWQLCQNRILLRAFITGTISNLYAFERLLYTIHTCHEVGVWHVARSSQQTAHETKSWHSLCSPFCVSAPCPCHFSMAPLVDIIIFVKPSRNSPLRPP
jgi:hypothetical protein